MRVTLAGITLLCFFALPRLASAPPPTRFQDEEPTPAPQQDCQECHLDVANRWSQSPHAHAFDDSVFTDQWAALGRPQDCLLCHTTNFQQTTGEYSAEGVDCEACHGPGVEGHPPAAVPIQADTEYCGGCHTTTLGEWRLTGHGGASVGCVDCHDPHSQNALFTNPDDLCINCHHQEMGDYLEDLHVQKDIGCVDCHALVIPPEQAPEDGIVPTGHSFTITPATCVACHTDALHAGFSLPGFEDGASAAVNGTEEDLPAEFVENAPESEHIEVMSAEQRLDTLEAAMASQRISTLFQGGVIGLTAGGTTAWILANNLRRRREEEDDEQE